MRPSGALGHCNVEAYGMANISDLDHYGAAIESC